LKNLLIFFNLIILFSIVNSQVIWKPIGQLGSGYISDIAINDSDQIFLAGCGRGIYRSTDYGESWDFLNSGLTSSNGLNSILINSSGHIFAGSYGYGNFRSVDNGETWTAINNGLTTHVIYEFVINSSNDIFVGTRFGGVFKSIDNGEHWIQTNAGLVDTLASDLAINSLGNIFVGTPSGMFISTNDGSSWNFLDSSIVRKPIYEIEISLNDNIYVGGNQGVYRSIDNGQHFLPVNNGLPSKRRIISIITDRNNNILVGTEDEGIFIMPDSADYWFPAREGLPIGYATVSYTMEVDSNNTYYCGIWPNGLYYSKNLGQNWHSLNNSLDGKHIKSILVDSLDYKYFATNEGLFLFEETEKLWLPLKNGIPENTGFRSLAVKNDTLFAGSELLGMFRSPDCGVTWNAINAGLPDSTTINSILVKENSIYCGTVNRGIYVSFNSGESWIAKNNGLANLGILSLEQNNNEIFAGTNGNGIFRTSDIGNNWAAINTGLTNFYINSIEKDSLNNIYIGTDDGVYKSINNGTQWSNFNNGLPDSLSVRIINSNKKNNLFLGSNGEGLYKFDSVSNSWISSNSGLLNDTVLTIYSHYKEGFIDYSIGTTNGVYHGMIITDPIDNIEEIEYKNSFILHQNYPNPFNQSTTIKFSLEKIEKVKIEVFNMLGQKVETILQKQLLAGSHQVEFHANDLSSGVYYYRIEAGNYQQLRKMILLK
jgi:ligand-binding sensor domain-containing protein